MIITALVFLLILSVLVLIHEAGHFFVARFFNIKVEEFGFGLPPRAWGRKIGETIYSINWLPIGGFVKLYGEDDAGSGKVTSVKRQASSPDGSFHSGSRDNRGVKDKDLDRAFFAKPAWQRALVVVAGVVMNSILAFVLFYVFLALSNFRTELPLLGEHQFFGVNQTIKTDIIVNGVAHNSPADKAGLTSFSKILTVNDKEITSMSEFKKLIDGNKGKKVSLSWLNVKTNQKGSGVITPRVNPPKNEGAIGVSFFAMETAVLSYDTPTQRLFSGIVHPTNLMVYNFDVIGKLIGISVKEKTAAPISEGVSGPVGIFSLVGTIIDLPDMKERLLQLLNLAGMLSISLAFFNVLPIPALDGGRLFFILIEMISGKKVNEKFEVMAHSIGMAVLLGLILIITFKDIFNLFR